MQGVKSIYQYQIKREGCNDEMTWEAATNFSEAMRILDDDDEQHWLGETTV